MDKNTKHLNPLILAHCLEQIEQQLNWGPSHQWTSKDFNDLSNKIFDKTEIRLSETTLKRVWGKVKYDNLPSTTTLDTLVKFLDYQSWRDFKLAQGSPPKEQLVIHKHKLKQMALLFLGIVFLTYLITHLEFQKRETYKANIVKEPKVQIDKEVVFNHKIISKDYPKTVIFHFDLAGKSSKNRRIQLSWDKQNVIKIEPHQKTATGIYYFPGLHHAKLIVDEKVIQEQAVILTSPFWFASLKEKNGGFIKYLNHELDSIDGVLKLKDAYAQKLNKEIPSKFIDYDYLPPFKNMSSDNFTLELNLKNESYEDNSNICQFSVLTIIGKKGLFYIPFSKDGCVSRLALQISEQIISGSKNDLSFLGLNLNKKQNVRITNQNKVLSIFVNNHLLKEFSYAKDIGKILGLKLTFEGSGEASTIKLNDALL